MNRQRAHATEKNGALKLFGAATLLAGLGGLPSVSDAQQTYEPLEEITVTATRRVQSVRDVPYNIQAISGNTLELLGARDQRDFARMVPGLSMVDSGARNGVDFVLRGLTTGGNSGTLGQTTTTYVDDTQVDLYLGLLDLKLLDVERIEVLRGPQGTLYGGGAIGGTIRYISSSPDLEEVSARLGTSLSSTRHGGNNYDVTGMVNLPLIEDRLAIRANLGKFDNGGYIDNTRLGVEGVNWDDTLSGRLAVLARPTDEFEIELTHYYQRGKYGDASVAVEGLGEYEMDYNAPVGQSRNRVSLTNLAVTYDLGWSELTSSSSYVNEREHALDDNTFFIRDQVFASFLFPEELPELTVTTERLTFAETFSQEFRLVSTDTEKWDWLVGAYWYDRDATERLQERVPIPFPGQEAFETDIIWAPLNDDKEYYFEADPSTIQQWAVFGEIGLRLTPELRVSLGARHFDYKLRETFYAIDQYFGWEARDENGLARTTPFPDEYSFGVADDDGQIFRFNASYDLSDDSLIYTTIAEGYRPGGFNLVTPNTGVPLDERAYDPDSIVSYEIGGKFALLDRRVYVSSAVYYIDWSDIQTDVPTDLGFSISGNAGKATVRGVELEVQSSGLFADGLSLSAGYSWTGAELEESIIDLGLAGNHVPYVAEHAASFVANYDIAMDNGWAAGITLNTSYTGDSYSTFGPFIPLEDGSLVPNAQFLKADAYWLTDFSARLSKPSWELRLFVDNVFDEDADLWRFFEDTSGSPYRDPYTIRSINRPRTIGLEFSWYVVRTLTSAIPPYRWPGLSGRDSLI